MNVHDVAIASLSDHRLFTVLDLAGTFAFAISGAAAARSRNLDLFGVMVVAFAVACGGGVVRDLCIGAVPPAGLADWRYLLAAMCAAWMTILANKLVKRLANPVIFFDSLGLGLFAVTGAQKALIFGHNSEVALLLGVVSAVGGGVIRDVLLNRVPVILRREIYASAALVGATIAVAGDRLGWDPTLRTWAALIACFTVRYLSLRYKWNLPRLSDAQDPPAG
ncbi:MAG TPA: trimeric intracellular cation channel family protein [Roseateles sp.]|uniref:trimeric intracellular cation channel family protein n=1 Tax=Roseateles sp. TaxID=1971397 RepID=UPI002EDA29A9